MRGLAFAIASLTCAFAFGLDLGKVHCIGDSLTEGAGSGVRGGGWRVQLTKTFDKANVHYQMVGNLGTGSGPLAGTNKQWNDGHGGWTTLDMVNGKPGSGSAFDWQLAFHPDTVILMIGQNDPYDWSDISVKYKALVDGLYALNPNLDLWWSNVGEEEVHNSYNLLHVTRADQAIRTLIVGYKSQGRKIHLLDVLGYTFNMTGIHDPLGVHYNDKGYDLIGNYFAKQILLGSSGASETSSNAINGFAWPPH